MPHQVLPGFKSAAANNRLIRTDHLPESVRTLGGQTVSPSPSALNDLTKLREYAPVLDAIDISSLLSMPASTDWDELQAQAVAVFTDSPALQEQLPYRREKIAFAAAAGASILMSLCEVMPRVAVKREIDDPDKYFAGYAMHSMGIVAVWPTLSQSADSSLHYALCSPKPREVTGQHFVGRRFHTKWFSDNAEDQRLEFRPDKLSDLRNDPPPPHPNHLLLGDAFPIPRKLPRHPTYADKHNTVSFGCPATPQIRALYRAMVEKAANDSLFSRTYANARTEIGYRDL